MATYDEILNVIIHDEDDVAAQANEKELLRLYYEMWRAADATQTAVTNANGLQAKIDVLTRTQTAIALFCPNRGGSLFDWGEGLFAGGALEGHISKYMKLAMEDLDFMWTTMVISKDKETKLHFVRNCLNIDKTYQNATGIDQIVLLTEDGKSDIRKWVDPSQIPIRELIEDWLEKSPKDNIFTGLQQPSSKTKTQLAGYVNKKPAERYVMWGSLINYIRTKKNMNSNQLQRYIRSNIPAIVQQIQPHTHSSVNLMLDFLDGWLESLVDGDPWEMAQGREDP